MLTACLDDDALAAYVDGALSADEVAQLDTHISGCASCRRDLSALAAARSVAVASGAAAEAGGELVPGETIGRYVVEREHARGGMGVVAVAFDPELGRNVALKVLRPDVVGQVPEHLRDEARAMAKLAHPNVVSVYDVGEAAGGRIFIAMELVSGVNLRHWLDQEPRSWRAVVRTLVRAGRGLAAAHRAGLVHRDFKPDNVLCGPEDRVRVTDFGLARGGDGAVRMGVGTGMVGTPAYMAPEVWRREPATARSDQWSYCVTLYEALFGTKPFTGENAAQLRAAVERGEIAPAKGRRVPARIVRTIQRGLARDPAARFATLDDLLRELDTALRRPPAIALAAGGVAFAALATIGVLALRGGAGGADACELPASLVAGAWNGTRANVMTASFIASGRKHAPETARRVRKLLDDYSAQWLATRTEACVATNVRGDQSATVLDARMRCLDRRRDELGELARELTDRPAADVVDHAVEAALGLHQLDSCSATGVVTEVPLPNDPVRAAQITGLDKELAAAQAALLVKRVDAATAQARSIVARAKPLGYAPLTARALRMLAQLSPYTSDHAEAERTLSEAIQAAAAAHDDRSAADMWVALMAFTAMQKGDAAAALELAKPAEAALLRADSPRELRGAFHHARGIAYAMEGKYAEASEAFQKAMASASTRYEAATSQTALCGAEVRLGHLTNAADVCKRGVAALEAELGPQHPMVAFALLNFGNVGLELHDDAGARATLERAIAILADTVGTKHVSYALAINNLGMIAARQGEFAKARDYYERAIATLEAAHHPDAYWPLSNLGNLDRQLGHAADSRANWERALAIVEKAQGPESDRAARAYYSLGSLDFDAGDIDGAARQYERALAVDLKLFGENHPQTAEALDGLGYVYNERHDCRRAITYQSRAVAVNEAVYGPDSVQVAETLSTLADCQAQLGNPQAVANLERALAIHGKFPDQTTFEPAFTRWTLAKALRRFHRDPAHARALAKEARDLFAKSPEPDAAKTIPEIDRWLGTH